MSVYECDELIQLLAHYGIFFFKSTLQKNLINFINVQKGKACNLDSQ